MIRHRLEVWSRTGDKRRAIFGALYRAERRQVLQGEEVATFEVSAQDGALSSLVSGSVLRLQREGVGADATLWRLTARAKTRGADDALRYQVTADALWMDLRQGMVRQRLIDGRALYTFGLNGLTPAQWLTDFILPGYEGTAVGFQLGVVEITDKVDLSFDRTNPLAALRMLEGAAEGEAQFRLDPSGLFYHVDFLSRVGAEQGTAELRYGKNLTGLEREEDETDVETRLYATGGGLLTLADAEWRIGALSGSTGARVITFDGPSPVFEDGAFTNPDDPAWLRVPGKGDYRITASVEPTGRITVNGTSLPALAAGDRGHLVTDAQGTRLAYLESPAGRADYGVRVGPYQAEDVPDAVNQIPNSDLSAWSRGLPTGWSKLGSPTVTEETDRYYAHQGERAARIVAAEGDAGILSPAFTLSNPADRPYTALLAGLVLISGSVRLELRRQGGETYPIGERPVLIDLGIYSTMTAGPVHDEPLPAGTYQVAVISHGGAAEWVLDCTMVSPVIGEEVPAYVAGSGAHLLWERAAWEIEERRRPRVEYRVDVADLYRADPAAFRFDELRLGDSVKLRDPEFPRETTRIVELTQDILDARATQVALADSARLRVHDPFRPPPPPLGGSRAGIGRRSSGTEGAAVLQVMRQWDGATGRLTLGALGSPVVATLELRTRTSPADPWVLADTITGRQGWFAPIADPSDDLLIQITPRDGRGVAGEAVEDTARGAKGADGEPSTSYWLTTGAASIKRSLAGAYTPASLDISARSQTGTAAPTAYAGRFVVATLEGSTWTDRYTSPGEQSSYTYTPPAGIAAVRVRLYMAGGTVALLDEVVVPVVNDGPKGDKGDPGPGALNPIISLVLLQLTGDQARYRISATTSGGSTAGLEYRRRNYTAATPEADAPGWPGFATLPAAGVEVWIPRDGRHQMILAAQVRETANPDRISNATDRIEPSQLTTFTDVEAEAGQAYTNAVATAGTYTDLQAGTAESNAKSYAESQASTARSGAYSDAITEVEGRGLHSDGYEGYVYRGSERISTSVLEDQTGALQKSEGAYQAAITDTELRGLTAQGFTGLLGGAGGIAAAVAAAQVQQPTQNRFRAGAGREYAFVGNLGELYEVPDLEVDLAAAGLRAGTYASLSAMCRTAINGNVEIGLYWWNAGGGMHISWGGLHFITQTSGQVAVASAVIPAGATRVRPVWRRQTNGNAAGYASEWMLTSGPVPQAYEPPGFRKGLDDQRALLAVIAANRNSVQKQQGPPILYAEYVHGAQAYELTIADHTVRYGFGDVTYNGATYLVSNFNVTIYVYADDPDLKGGSFVYGRVLSPADVIRDGRYYVGKITLGGQGGGSSTGGGGAGGGDGFY